MRTDSSPSVISISAMPDSSSSSMSFLTLRMSMDCPRQGIATRNLFVLKNPSWVFQSRRAGACPDSPPSRGSCPASVLALRRRRDLLQAAHRRGQGQLVADGTAAADAARGDVREIGMAAEVLAPERVADVHLDEGQRHRQEGVAQGDAGVGIAAGIE